MCSLSASPSHLPANWLNPQYSRVAHGQPNLELTVLAISRPSFVKPESAVCGQIDVVLRAVVAAIGSSFPTHLTH